MGPVVVPLDSLALPPLKSAVLSGVGVVIRVNTVVSRSCQTFTIDG